MMKINYLYRHNLFFKKPSVGYDPRGEELWFEKHICFVMDNETWALRVAYSIEEHSWSLLTGVMKIQYCVKEMDWKELHGEW